MDRRWKDLKFSWGRREWGIQMHANSQQRLQYLSDIKVGWGSLDWSVTKWDSNWNCLLDIVSSTLPTVTQQIEESLNWRFWEWWEVWMERRQFTPCLPFQRAQSWLLSISRPSSLRYLKNSLTCSLLNSWSWSAARRLPHFQDCLN